MSESIKMTRSEINEAMAKYFADGGKVTKLPDGPNWNFNPYGVRVPKSNNVDLTAIEICRNLRLNWLHYCFGARHPWLKGTQNNH